MDELRLSSLRPALEEDTASQAVLHSLHKPLLRRFAQICGSPSREGLPLDGGLDARMTRVPVAEMIGDLRQSGLLLHDTITVAAEGTPRGQPPISLVLSLDEAAVQAAAKESLKRQQNGAQAEVTTLDFDEYLCCLSLCGMVAFRAIAAMPVAERIKAFLHQILGGTYAGEASGLAAYVWPHLSPDAAAPAGAGRSIDVPAGQHLLMQEWEGLAVRECPGWPLWEAGVFRLLAEHQLALRESFARYAAPARGGAAAVCSSAQLGCWADDADLLTDAFGTPALARLAAEVAGKEYRSGGGIALPHFLALLVHAAFHRANPGYEHAYAG